MNELNIDKIRDAFFKKSLSVGHHNVLYTWKQLMIVILSCIRGIESLEEGAKTPSAQTVRDRLCLDGDWLTYFHQAMWMLASQFVRRFSRFCWYISIDETFIPFFGKREKLNELLVTQGWGKMVHGYRAKTPGATGSFCFVVISLCCCKIRLPIAIKMVVSGENYQDWLESKLKRLHKLVPKAIVLADRGYGKATWFYSLCEKLKLKYVVRIPLRKKESKNKAANGIASFQQWMKDKKTKEEVLLTIYATKDEQNREYFLASNLDSYGGKKLLQIYLNRWDLENIFKDSDRVQLPTSSRNPIMRLFSVIVAFFIFTLWQAERTENKVTCSLRTFVKYAIYDLCNLLGLILASWGRFVKSPP